MDCRIQWNSLSVEEWNERFSKIRRSPITQSYDYARASYPKKGQTGKWGVIKINDDEAGLVQMAEASTLFGLFQAIILDLGPLWFNNNHLKEKTESFFQELDKQFPMRLGRKRRIIPLLPNSKNTDQIFVNKGFIPQKESSYETIWLDLTLEEDILRRNLKQKWRNQLNRSEKQNLVFEVDQKGETIPAFLLQYHIDFYEKNYKNILPKDVSHFFTMFAKTGNAHLCHAKFEDQIVASALIFSHGCSATYQIGVVSETGRQLLANYFLLWEAIKYLKANGVKDFDLGGINEYDAKGVQHFKEGLNGEKTCIEGIFS